MTFSTKVLVPSVLAILGTGTMVSAQNLLNAAGASFPAPFYQRAFSDLANSGGPKVNYQSVGSGAGVRQFIAGTVDFAATDEPISSADAAKVRRGVVQLPTVGGTIAIAFNKPGCNLKLTQKQVADVFLGAITDWRQLNCSAGKITVVHRSDGSGTTFAFTNSLSTFSPTWKSKVGEGKAVKWPVGVGGKGNEGVSGVIQNTPGSIGYLNQAFVKGKIKAAAVQNKAGKFVLPNLKGGAAALNNIKLNSMLAGEEPNPAGADSYPISTLTWVLAYRSGNGAKTGNIRRAISHLLSPAAQSKADDLGYVPLRSAILNSAKKAVGRIGS